MLIAMNGNGFVAFILKQLANLIAVLLCPCKDDKFGPNFVMRFHKVQNSSSLVHLCHIFGVLNDRGVECQVLITNFEFDRVIFADFTRKLLDFSRPSRRKKHCLLVGAHTICNGSDLRVKTHILDLFEFLQASYQLHQGQKTRLHSN